MNEAEAQQRPGTTLLGPPRWWERPGGTGPPVSPAQGVGQPGLGGAAGAAVAPREDRQRGGGGAALRAVDRLVRPGAGLGDLTGALLVDLLVAPAGATQVSYGAASTGCGDGASFVRVDATASRAVRRRLPGSCAPRGGVGTPGGPRECPAPAGVGMLEPHGWVRRRRTATLRRPVGRVRGTGPGAPPESPAPVAPARRRPGGASVRHAAAAPVPRHVRGGVRGPTRPAPDGRSPYRPAQPATAPASDDDVIAVLARAVREVEAAAQRGRGDAVGAHEVPGRRAAGCARSAPGSGPTGRSARPSRDRAAQAARRDRDDPRARPPPATPSLLALLAEDAVVSDAARALTRDMLRGRRRRGRRPRRSPRREPAAAADRARAPGRAAVGDLPAAGQPVPRPRLLRRAAAAPPRPRRLAGWELLGPLLRSFEQAGGGAPACMALPDADLACTRRAAAS